MSDPCVYCNVEYELMKRTYFALEVARDNAIEVRNSFLFHAGAPLTEREEQVLKTFYDKDVAEVEYLINAIAEQWKFGV